jgi:hypothetical protein
MELIFCTPETGGNLIARAPAPASGRLLSTNEESVRVFGVFWYGHVCKQFRDVPTMGGDTLSERYEKTMARFEKITRAGYEVETIWECEFDEGILAHHPELQVHPMVEHCPLNTSDALYGGRTEAMRLHYRIREGETIRYTDVMSLYPFCCKYHKSP